MSKESSERALKSVKNSFYDMGLLALSRTDKSKPMVVGYQMNHPDTNEPVNIEVTIKELSFADMQARAALVEEKPNGFAYNTPVEKFEEE